MIDQVFWWTGAAVCVAAGVAVAAGALTVACVAFWHLMKIAIERAYEAGLAAGALMAWNRAGRPDINDFAKYPRVVVRQADNEEDLS